MKDRNTENETDKGRRDRVAFGSHRTNLQVRKQDPNYVYRWFNDTADRIQRALDAGYEHVTSKMMGKEQIGDRDINSGSTSLDSNVSKRVNGQLTVYYMRIKREWWETDQKAKQLEADAIDEAIFGGGAENVQHSYGLDVKYRNR